MRLEQQRYRISVHLQSQSMQNTVPSNIWMYTLYLDIQPQLHAKKRLGYGGSSNIVHHSSSSLFFLWYAKNIPNHNNANDDYNTINHNIHTCTNDYYFANNYH